MKHQRTYGKRNESFGKLEDCSAHESNVTEDRSIVIVIAIALAMPTTWTTTSDRMIARGYTIIVLASR